MKKSPYTSNIFSYFSTPLLQNGFSTKSLQIKQLHILQQAFIMQNAAKYIPVAINATPNMRSLWMQNIKE